MSESSKKRAVIDESDALQKRPKADSTAVVVVGGEEFHECVHTLRSISDYFDGAIRSGRKESIEMRFEFPDKDPREWKLVKSLCSLFPTEQLTVLNWKVALSWFDQLCIPAGLKACDEFLLAFMNSKKLAWVKEGKFPFPNGDAESADFVKNIGRLLEYSRAALQFQLGQSKAKSLELISDIVEYRPTALTSDHWVTIWSLLNEHEDFCLKLWDAVQDILPSYASDKPQHELLQNDCLPRLVFAKVQLEEKLYALRAIKETLEDKSTAAKRCGLENIKKLLLVPGVYGPEFMRERYDYY